MSTLEIVHLRSSGEVLDTLNNLIKESIWAQGYGTEVVTLYRRQGLETDIAIHIRFRDEVNGKVPSALALHLAHELTAFGMVQHTVWEEMA